MLRDYLDAVLVEPWRWGYSDCCFFAGDWIRMATGLDPLAPYRDRYASAIGAGRLIDRAGGLIALVAPEMERCGFRRTSAAQHGDVGILAMTTQNQDAPARACLVIKDGPWWVGRTETGIAGAVAMPDIGWAILPRMP